MFWCGQGQKVRMVNHIDLWVRDIVVFNAEIVGGDFILIDKNAKFLDTLAFEVYGSGEIVVQQKKTVN